MIKMKMNIKKNQMVIFAVALMLVAAGYLNYTTNETQSNLIPTSTLADAEQMASIGDATLVSANAISDNSQKESTEKQTEASSISNDSNSQNQENTSSNVADTQTQPTNTEADNYFMQSRLDRDNMYSQMLENYQIILESNFIPSNEKDSAQTEVKRISNEKNAIMIAENLIKTKGFEDVVLFVNNGNVSAVIKAEKLEAEQVAQLQNIITRELQVEANKINVSSKK